MLFSKRSLEGCLTIDHRNSPGLKPEEVPYGFMAVPGGQLFESPSITCNHCQVIVILNPNRTRSRGYCPKCDSYVCDTCEAVRVLTGMCHVFERTADEFLNFGVKGDQVSQTILAKDFETRRAGLLKPLKFHVSGKP